LKPFAKSPRKNTRRKNEKTNKNKDKIMKKPNPRKKIIIKTQRKLLPRPKENYYQDPNKI